MIVRNVDIAERELFYNSCQTVISYIAQCRKTTEASETAETPSIPSVSDLLYFDIETTGLSSKEAFVYLIGCMYDSENGPVFTQLLAEDPSEEVRIISAFDEIVRMHDVAVHYNGTTFDVPFLAARAEHCGVSLRPFISQIDVYKEIKPLKSIFRMKSMKMKAVEEYLGIKRQDLYDGGELIELYIKYVSLKKLENLKRRGAGSVSNCGSNSDSLSGTAADSNSVCSLAPAQPSGQNHPKHKIVSSFSDHTGLRMIGNENCSELLRILLLHNYEDVINMLPVSSLLNAAAFIKGAFELSAVTADHSSVRFELDPLSRDVTDFFTKSVLSSRARSFFHAHTPSGDDKTISCLVSGGKIIFELETAETELKLFFPDYKNYYYLINEDYAIHKSIGQFVDKERCVKCTAANCYTRKQGTFVPVFEKKGGALGDMVYLYRRSAPDKSLYITVDDLIADSGSARIYILQLFTGLF